MMGRLVQGSITLITFISFGEFTQLPGSYSALEWQKELRNKYGIAELIQDVRRTRPCLAVSGHKLGFLQNNKQ